MEILKLMEDTRDNVLDLLDAICKSNPFWEILRKEDGEAAWTRLCQIIDLSEKEWLEKAKRDEEDTEDEEDAEDEEEEDAKEEVEGDSCFNP